MHVTPSAIECLGQSVRTHSEHFISVTVQSGHKLIDIEDNSKRDIIRFSLLESVKMRNLM
jgi:hypothetical protein